MTAIAHPAPLGRRDSPAATTSVHVVGSPANETTTALAEAWRALGIPASVRSAAEAAALLGSDDVVVARLDVLPTLDGVEPGLLALLELERRGVRVVNTVEALLGAHDKLRTARLLAAAGLPHPRTTPVGPRAALGVAPPVVLKPRFGSWGRGVVRCESERALASWLRTVAREPWFRRHGAIAQEVVPSAGHDLRVVVAGGHAVAAAERVAAPGEWRTNVSLGGSLRPATLTAAAEELALLAAAAIGAEFVGVDLMPVEGGYVVLELNGAAEFDSRYAIRGADVYADTARALGLPASRTPRP